MRRPRPAGRIFRPGSFRMSALSAHIGKLVEFSRYRECARSASYPSFLQSPAKRPLSPTPSGVIHSKSTTVMPIGLIREPTPASATLRLAPQEQSAVLGRRPRHRPAALSRPARSGKVPRSHHASGRRYHHLRIAGLRTGAEINPLGGGPPPTWP